MIQTKQEEYKVKFTGTVLDQLTFVSWGRRTFSNENRLTSNDMLFFLYVNRKNFTNERSLETNFVRWFGQEWIICALPTLDMNFIFPFLCPEFYSFILKIITKVSLRFIFLTDFKKEGCSQFDWFFFFFFFLFSQGETKRLSSAWCK